MTSVNKQQLKELKRPDALQVQLSAILNWILENARYAVFAVVPVLVGMGGYYGFRYFKDQKKNARLEELGKVQVVYENEQRKAADARQAINTKIEALEKKAAPKSENAAAADQAAPAASAKDPKVAQEQEALRKELALVRADHSESLGKYIEFGKKYADVPEGWLAGMMAAQIFAEDGKASEARQVLEGVLAQSGDQAFYQTQGRLFLVGLLEEAGEWDKALSELDTLDKTLDKQNESELKATSLFARGRIQFLKDAKEDAKKTFALLLEKHGGSPEAQKARAYQTLLN